MSRPARTATDSNRTDSTNLARKLQLKYVTEDLQLIPEWGQPRPVPFQVQQAIRTEVLAVLRERNRFVSGIVDIKIVSNPEHNYINLRLRQHHNHMIHYEEFKGERRSEDNDVPPSVVCFYMSDKFEPYVIITILDEFGERITALEPKHIAYLSTALGNFKKRYGISEESYHYTGLDERHETFSNEAVDNQNRGHSMNFHLKMRIGTAMYLHQMPIMRLLNVSELKDLDPIRYNYSRSGVSYEEIMKKFKQEVGLA